MSDHGNDGGSDVREVPPSLTTVWPDYKKSRVIARTPVIKPEGSEPGCIVVRENETHYVVHNAETDEAGNFVGFFWGHYYHKHEPDALKNAMRKFVDKTIRWHMLGEWTE